MTFSKPSLFCLVFLNNFLCCFKKSPNPAPYFRVNTVDILTDTGESFIRSDAWVKGQNTGHTREKTESGQPISWSFLLEAGFQAKTSGHQM